MSTGFTFGSNAATPAFGAAAAPSFGNASSTGQFGFGTNTQQQATGFQLGTALNKPTGSVAPQPATFGFGTPASTANTGFGFGGTSATAPAAGLGTGSSFGAPASSSAPAGFGLGTTPASTAPGLSFGATSGGFGFGAQQTAAPNFGASQPTTNLSFGAPQTTATNLSFGAPQTTTSNLSFGAPQTTTSSLSFGTPQATATNLSFGAPKTTAPSYGATNLTFGAPTTSTPALPFGAPTSTTTSTGFGALSTPSTSLSLGAPLGGTNTGLTIGGTTAASTTTGFSLGGLTSSVAPTPTLNFGTSITTSTPSTGISFGPASAAPTLSFGASTTSQNASGSMNFKTIPNTGFGLMTSTNTTAAPSDKVGLGGIQTSTATSSSTAIQKEVPPKEQLVPNEIQQDIEKFKNYIKLQKMYSSDVSRCSVKDFRLVDEQIRLLNNVIKEVEIQLDKNKSMAEKLKYDTARGLELLEMAQRTQDTPAGLQYENMAPMYFFLKLVDLFETEMQNLRTQIEDTDKYVKDFGQPATLTAQDLSNGMRRLHDTFVALAGRLHSVHSQVETQKELYMNLKKQITNDSTNPFEGINKQVEASFKATVPIVNSPPKIACGPTPFNQVTIPNFPITSQQNFGMSGLGLATSSGGFATPKVPLFGTSTGLNKTNTGFQNTTLGSETSFQLQKPPTGNKRGKQ